MSPIRRGGIFYLRVPRAVGTPLLRTCQTSDKVVYNGMKRMLADLKSQRKWTLLQAIIDGTRTMGQVYDAHTAKTLDALEASLAASALDTHVTNYLAVLKGRGKAPRHVQNIKQQLAQFLAKHSTTADLTNANVTAWLAGLTMTPGTRRQYCFAVTGLARYLVAVDVMADYPLGKVVAPDKNPARMTYHDAATDERIVQAASPQYRALFALIKGTGCDVSTALHLSRQDIDLDRAVVRMRGTKTAQRDVHEGLIEAWAIPYLRDYCRLFLYVNVQMWPAHTRSGAYHHHQRCSAAAGVTKYTLKDSRHSVAVRMAKAGYTVQEIAEQLGNSPELVARVYARFIPEMQHRVTPGVTRPSEVKNAAQ